MRVFFRSGETKIEKYVKLLLNSRRIVDWFFLKRVITYL